MKNKNMNPHRGKPEDITEAFCRGRMKAGFSRPEHPAPGTLSAYRKTIRSADTGAVWL